MPYISKKHRVPLEPAIDALADTIQSVYSANEAQQKDGLVNFAVTELLNKLYPNARYTDLNEIVGVLECIKLEYYRKRISPYEDLKESENGAVRTFDE